MTDPRFEGGGGSSKLNYDIFRKAYGFLGEYQDSEIEELKKSLKKEKNQVGREAWCGVGVPADSVAAAHVEPAARGGVRARANWLSV